MHDLKVIKKKKHSEIKKCSTCGKVFDLPND